MTFVYKYLSCNPLRVKDHRDLGGCCETSYSLEVLFGEKLLVEGRNPFGGTERSTRG